MVKVADQGAIAAAYRESTSGSDSHVDESVEGMPEQAAKLVQYKRILCYVRDFLAKPHPLVRSPPATHCSSSSGSSKRVGEWARGHL